MTEIDKEEKLIRNNQIKNQNLSLFLNIQEEVEEDILETSRDTGEEFLDIKDIVAQKKYKVIEFFAGAGGLALGLEKAGFSAVLLNEFDKYAAATLRKNRPEWLVIEEDIVELVEKGISKYINTEEEIDLISGGYPCQAFSYAGKGLGLEDARGTLFYPFAKVIEELKPKMFLAENVKGLVSHDNGKTLKIMLDVYEKLGYFVKYKIMNALDYGVAQKRERVVIVGIRNDLKEEHNLEYKFPKPFNYRLNLGDILKNVPESEVTNYSSRKKEIMKLIPPGGCWRNLPDEIAKEYMGASYYLGGGKTGMARRLSWNEPGLTVLCSPSQKQTERCHPDEVRPFTVRENARIQSFPDEWEFVGSVASKYKQIGNAVPVNFAEAIGKSLISVLNRISKDEENTVDEKVETIKKFFNKNEDLRNDKLSEEEAVINKYKEALKMDPYKGKISQEPYDPLILEVIDEFKIIDKLGFDSLEELCAKDIFKVRVLFKSIENIFGNLLEDFIDQSISDYGWIRCTGELFKGVDFIKGDSEALQIKNKYNTENSSSSKIRKGTKIIKWNRLKKKSKNKIPLTEPNWEKLQEMITENQDEKVIKEIKKVLTEEKFKEFVLEKIKNNPQVLKYETLESKSW